MTPSAYEYENVALLPGEDAVFAADFTASPLLRHIKTGLVVTRERVVVRYPQYMFLVLKVGHVESSVPIRHVCNITAGRQLSQRRVMTAAIAGGIGFFMLMSSFSMMSMGPMGAILLLMALGLLAFAAFQAWLARGLALIVGHGGGGSLRVDVEKAEYDAMLDANRLIQELVAEIAHAVPTATPSAVEHATPNPVTPYAPQPGLSARPAPTRESHVTSPRPDPTRAAPSQGRPPELAPQRSSAPPSIWRA